MILVCTKVVQESQRCKRESAKSKNNILVKKILICSESEKEKQYNFNEAQMKLKSLKPQALVSPMLLEVGSILSSDSWPEIELDCFP